MFTSAPRSGEIWGSRDEGRTWKCLAAHLPHVYAVEVALNAARRDQRGGAAKAWR